jgi:hypothetical protein
MSSLDTVEEICLRILTLQCIHCGIQHIILSSSCANLHGHPNILRQVQNKHQCHPPISLHQLHSLRHKNPTKKTKKKNSPKQRQNNTPPKTQLLQQHSQKKHNSNNNTNSSCVCTLLYVNYTTMHTLCINLYYCALLGVCVCVFFVITWA